MLFAEICGFDVVQVATGGATQSSSVPQSLVVKDTGNGGNPFSPAPYTVKKKEPLKRVLAQHWWPVHSRDTLRDLQGRMQVAYRSWQEQNKRS